MKINIIVITFLLVLGFFLALFLSFLYIQTTKYIKIHNEIENIENYLSSPLQNKPNVPSFCPQNVIHYSSKYNIPFPELFPIGGIPFQIKESEDREGNIHTVVNDRFGFRNNDLIWNKKKISTVFLGDSIVLALDIKKNKTFTELIRKSMHPSLNLACGGNGSYTNTSIIFQFLEQYNVDNILLFLNLENDLPKDNKVEWDTNLFNHITDKKKIPSIFENQKKYQESYIDFVKKILSEKVIENKQKMSFAEAMSINQFLKFFKDFFAKITGSINSNTAISSSTPKTQYTIDMYNKFLHLLEALREKSLEKKVNIIFVIVPSKEEINLIRNFDSEKANTDLRSLILNYKKNKNNIMTKIVDFHFDVIDLSEVILKNKDKNIYDSHFTEEGHLLVAKHISDHLNSEMQGNLRSIVYYNSFDTTSNLTNYTVNKQLNLSYQNYKSWFKNILYYFKNKKYDELLISPFLSYSLGINECKNILKVIDLLDSESKLKRVPLLFSGLCELQLKAWKDDKNNAINKIKKSLVLNISDIFPLLAKDLEEILARPNEVK